MHARTILIIGIMMILTACAGGAAEPPAPTDAAISATEEPTHTPTPTETPVPTPLPLVVPRDGRVFTYYGEDPGVPNVPRGPDARWDGKFINPGGMIHHDGTFYMFRNGFKNWPGLVSIGYMTSPDGLAWTEVQEAPVFASDQVPYVADGDGADVSSVIVLEDGTWVFYFHVVSNTEVPVIGLATAPSPEGPWMVAPDPVVLAGGPDTWDRNGVAWPSVVPTDTGYAMYYAGFPSAFEKSMIGMAVSADGMEWEKYDDPGTMEVLFSESDPVLVGNETWTTDGVDRARVVDTPEGLVMIYQGGALIKRGLAFSADGIRWVLHPENPVLELKDFPLSGNMWDTALVYHDGVYYYYTEIGSTAATNIYLAIHEGEIKPDDLPELVSQALPATLPEGVRVLQLEDMLLADPSSVANYTSFLKTNDLSLGVYALGAAAPDNQSPHAKDEVYYVVQGQADLVVGEETLPVTGGSYVYVAAQVPHRFEFISADLQTLVFFSEGPTDAANPSGLAFQVDDLVVDVVDVPFLDVGSMASSVLSIPDGERRELAASGEAETIVLVLEGQGMVRVGEGSGAVSAGTIVHTSAGLAPTFEAEAEGFKVLVFVAR